MYKVIREFSDKEDGHRVYRVGDKYPRKGFDATEERVESLLSGKNATGKVYIEPLPEKKKTKKEG